MFPDFTRFSIRLAAERPEDFRRTLYQLSYLGSKYMLSQNINYVPRRTRCLKPSTSGAKEDVGIYRHFALLVGGQAK